MPFEAKSRTFTSLNLRILQYIELNCLHFMSALLVFWGISATLYGKHFGI